MFAHVRSVSLYSLCLSLTLSLACGEISIAAESTTQHPAIQERPRHNVQAIQLPSTSVDNQTSWIIEPDVPRVPNIAGLNPQLPPHVHKRLSYAFDLAQRGATFSANAEFRAVLGMCALELDGREGGTSRREALRQAWRAFEEADDFNGNRIVPADVEQVRIVAASHETPVLHRDAKSTVDSIHAVQAYYAFAEERFSYACHGLPGASLAFYGLGRTYIVPGAQLTHAAGKAATLHRAALAIAPQNNLAANELGVLLAEHGQLNEAEQLFRKCLATNPTPETWRNLAVVHARRGDKIASQAAYAAADALANKNPSLASATHASPRDNRSNEAADSDDETEKQGLFEKFNISKLRSPFWR